MQAKMIELMLMLCLLEIMRFCGKNRKPANIVGKLTYLYLLSQKKNPPHHLSFVKETMKGMREEK